MSPANDHNWRTSVPTAHGFGVQTTTAAGPALYLPDPSSRDVAEFEGDGGTNPQINSLDVAGDR